MSALITKGTVSLRPFTHDDIPNKVRWINDPLNNQYLHYDLPLSIEETERWFEAIDSEKRVDCVIECDGVPVGVIGLLQIDRANRKAEYYITVGERDYQHRGIAKIASECILKYAFDTLHLHKVYLNTDADNLKAVELYEKAGAVREGYFKDDLMRDGRLIDRVRYAWINKGE